MDAKKIDAIAQLALVAAASFFSQAPALAQTAEKQQAGGTLNMLMQPEPATLILALNRQGPTQFAAGIVSGAGHDAVYVAGQLPVAMTFVPSKDGVSYNEIEDAKSEHLEAGCNVLLDAMLRAAS